MKDFFLKWNLEKVFKLIIWLTALFVIASIFNVTVDSNSNNSAQLIEIK